MHAFASRTHKECLGVPQSFLFTLSVTSYLFGLQVLVVALSIIILGYLMRPYWSSTLRATVEMVMEGANDTGD